MLEAIASTTLSNLDLSKVVLAIESLGTAASGVVDTSKAFWDGVSNRGFGDVRKVISKFSEAGTTALALSSALATLLLRCPTGCLYDPANDPPFNGEKICW